MTNVRTLAAVHTHKYSLKNEKNTRVIRAVVTNTVLVCYAKISKNLNRYLNNIKYINSSNMLCKVIEILEISSNIYCDVA